MPQKRVSVTLLALSFALATELAIGLSWASSAQAQFRPPLGTPRGTADTNRTTFCLSYTDHTAALTVLVPSNQVVLTTEAHPTFFLYLPKTTAKVAEFFLIDSNDNDVYRTLITLPGKSGLVSFQLPADAPPLEVGKDYGWYFNVVCEPSDRLKDDSTHAWIQRIEPNQALVRALKTAPTRKRPNLYAQAGIWQDTLTTLAELRRTNPNDRTLTKEWSDLLKSVGLGQIPESPAIGQLSLGTTKPQ